tara:strand:+ start:298 stop:441 length:144 start_codon:yes stop_codon:yes gene_type:complete
MQVDYALIWDTRFPQFVFLPVNIHESESQALIMRSAVVMWVVPQRYL